jgi:hypothetical protein
MAGSTGSAGNPLVADFVQVGRKLEKLGFVYNKGDVLALDPEEVE